MDAIAEVAPSLGGGSGRDGWSHGSAASSLRRTTCATRSEPAGRSSVTPATTATRSPATASPTRSGTPSCWPRRCTPHSRDRHERGRGLAAYQAERDDALAETFALTRELAGFPHPSRFVELQIELSEALDREAQLLASRPAPAGQRAVATA